MTTAISNQPQTIKSIANDPLALIDVDYKPLPAVASLAAAQADGAAQV